MTPTNRFRYLTKHLSDKPRGYVKRLKVSVWFCKEEPGSDASPTGMTSTNREVGSLSAAGRGSTARIHKRLEGFSLEKYSNRIVERANTERLNVCGFRIFSTEGLP